MATDGTSVTLFVTRPLAHSTYSIATYGTTSMLFATGTATAANPIRQHGSNRGVRGPGCIAQPVMALFVRWHSM
jgi:hypothetical protein